MTTPAQIDEGSTLTLRDVAQRVEGLRLRNLEPESLLKLRSALKDRQQQFLREALREEKEILEELQEGKSMELSQSRMQIRALAQQAEEVEEEIVRVEDAYQEKVLRERLAAKLGGRGRLVAMESIVFFLIIVILAALFYEFSNPNLPLETERKIFWLDAGCCMVFLIDFFVRLRCAESRTWFWKRYWFDFVTSIPLPDAQILRVGRLARLTRVFRLFRVVRILRLLRFLRILMLFWRGLDKLRDCFDVKLFRKSLMVGLVILFGGALVINTLEGNLDPEVGTFGQSVWWSFTTVVTGGFGDIYNPVSPVGRVLTVFLILGGMTVVGVFTATLTAVLVGDESERIILMEQSLGKKLECMDQRIERIEALLAKPGEKSEE